MELKNKVVKGVFWSAAERFGMLGLQAVISLLQQADRRRSFGEFGRDLVRDKFPWRKMSDFLIEDYRNFLAEKKREA